jgi:hypothetical protein
VETVVKQYLGPRRYASGIPVSCHQLQAPTIEPNLRTRHNLAVRLLLDACVMVNVLTQPNHHAKDILRLSLLKDVLHSNSPIHPVTAIVLREERLQCDR